MSGQAKTYKSGWVIDGRVIGLTHYTDHVTMEEFQQISAIAARLTGAATKPFYFIIDNRNINMDRVLSLADLQGAVSYMNHPLLRGVVTIVPRLMGIDADSLPLQQHGDVHLKFVNTVDEAFEHLAVADVDLFFDEAALGFFK